MKVVITPTAQRQIDSQISFGIERFGRRVAELTFGRISRFFATTLADYPKSGRSLATQNLHETLIPRTPFVVIYRIEAEADIVRVLGFFHYAQDRTNFEADDES